MFRDISRRLELRGSWSIDKLPTNLHLGGQPADRLLVHARLSKRIVKSKTCTNPCDEKHG
jgi:hypothetical protein